MSFGEGGEDGDGLGEARGLSARGSAFFLASGVLLDETDLGEVLSGLEFCLETGFFFREAGRGFLARRKVPGALSVPALKLSVPTLKASTRWFRSLSEPDTDLSLGPGIWSSSPAWRLSERVSEFRSDDPEAELDEAAFLSRRSRS